MKIKILLLRGRVMAFLGLLGFILVLSACAPSQSSAITDVPDVKVTKPANSQNSTASESKGAASTSQQGSVSTVNYKGVAITVVSADQQKQFSDDATSTGPVVLRVNIHEQNTSADGVYLYYNDAARLILPDGRSLAPETNAAILIPGSIVRNSWLDFSLGSKQDVNRLILRIGTASEQQMNIPLTRNPDLTKYQSKSIALNAKLHYGIDWTITKVTTSLSAGGEQADANKRYIIVELRADNATDEAFYPSPGDNIRLQSNTVTQAPKDTTLPGSIAPHSTGTISTITFLMPDKDSNFQLQFLAQPTQKINAAHTNFQI